MKTLLVTGGGRGLGRVTTGKPTPGIVQEVSPSVGGVHAAISQSERVTGGQPSDGGRTTLTLAAVVRNHVLTCHQSRDDDVELRAGPAPARRTGGSALDDRVWEA